MTYNVFGGAVGAQLIHRPLDRRTSHMRRIVLDTNIFDKLEVDDKTLTFLNELSSNEVVEVVVPYVVLAELQDSRHRGIPDWVHATPVLDSVSVLPFKLGTSALGVAKTYGDHLGESEKRSDAKIADAANAYAEVFVSEDNRCRKRAITAAPNCLSIDYDGFRAWLERLKPGAV